MDMGKKDWQNFSLTLKIKKVEIYAISIDTPRLDWENFVQTNDLRWINVYEENGWLGKSAKQYNLYATPTMFLLDRDRKIISKPITFKDFKNAVDELE